MSVKKNNKKCVDYGIMLSVFLVALIHLWGIFTYDANHLATITDYGNYHLVYWYPLQCCCIEMIFSLFLLWKAHRFESCIYTKLATYFYLIIASISLIHMIVLDDGVIWELRFNQLIFQEILEKIGTALIFLMVICFVARATWCFDDKERRKALLTKIKKFFQKLWSKLKRK